MRIWTLQPSGSGFFPAVSLPMRRLRIFCWNVRSMILSKDEWRELIAGIPEDVKKEIGRLKTAGTQIHLRICLIVQGHQLAL